MEVITLTQRRKPPVVFNGKGKDRIILVRCLKCDYRWFPNARRWGNYENGKGKTLRCPKCQHRNYLPPNYVEVLIGQAERLPEVRFVTREEKEDILRKRRK